MNEKEVPTNQTQFGNIEPILESEPQYDSEIPEEKQKPGSIKKVVFGVVAVVSVVLAILLALFLFMNPQPTVEEVIPSPSPVVLEPVKVGELEQVFRDLQRDLKSADPTDTQLLFPPVSTEIYIDEPDRR